MIAIIEFDTCHADGTERMLRALEASPSRASSAADIVSSDAIVIPNGRSFRRALKSLRELNLVPALTAAAQAGKAILGIGMGMHLLFDVSHEDGQHTCLGMIHGHVTRFDFGRHPAARHFSVPHQGWNRLAGCFDHPLLQGLSPDDFLYFHHSHHASPLSPKATLASCLHGIEFAAVAQQRNAVGVQFLPERSEAAGITFLRNFLSPAWCHNRDTAGAEYAA